MAAPLQVCAHNFIPPVDVPFSLVANGYFSPDTLSSGKLALSTNSSTGAQKEQTKVDAPRPYQPVKRFGSETSTSAKNNPFNGIAPLTTTSVTSSTSGASSAFGLGSGAFASFGSAGKTPRTPGTTLDSALSATPAPTAAAAVETRDKENGKDTQGSNIKPKGSLSSLASKSSGATTEHPLKSTWIVWYRPPTSKYTDYEKSTIALAHFASVEAFWTVYTHLKRPSVLPAVSDYHIFKKGIRPVWEDEENKRGGKWILRLKKGVVDRYWEDLLLAIVGDQFAEAGEEVCGAVLSVRTGEDVLSVWTRIDGGRNIKIRYALSHGCLNKTSRLTGGYRETIKRLLALPSDTNIVWKSHDDSIAQRSAIDEARKDKGVASGAHHGAGKRRETITEDPSSERAKGLRV